jgi:glycerol kinase
MVLWLSFSARGIVRAVEWGVAKTADRCSRRQHRRGGNESTLDINIGHEHATGEPCQAVDWLQFAAAKLN